MMSHVWCVVSLWGYEIKSCCVSFCSVLARSALVRTGLYKCTVLCTAVENTVQSGLQHCSHSRLGREAVRDCPGVKQFTKQQVWDTHSAVSSQHKNCSSKSRLRDTEREATVSSEQTQATRTREDQQQVIKVSAFILTVYYIYTNTQLATLSVYSLQKYKFQLCNCFRSRTEYLHLYLSMFWFC